MANRSPCGSTSFDGDSAVYQATVVPWLWLLTHTTDCRIFQDRAVPDIIKEILREHGYTDFKESLTGELYRSWNYCVQYRETDFDFISRLMEQEGISYYFKHEDGKHTLALADNYGAHDPIPGDDTAPRKSLLTIRHHPHPQARADLERFDYPGGYTQRDQGDEGVRTHRRAASGWLPVCSILIALYP